MIGRIFAVALLAGLAAGLFASVVQHFTTTPLILHAEEFENKSAALGGHQPVDLASRGVRAEDWGAKLYLAHGAAGHGDGAEAWGPEDGLERTLYTTLADVITGIGFALVLTALIVLRGQAVDGRQGLLWGIAGFTAVSLAPALGLPPELPGSMAAELVARQGWWAIAAASTAVGLALMFLGRAAWMPYAGIALLILPHLVGAPHPDEIGGAVPPELAGHFVAASLVSAAAFWAFLGWATGSLAKRFELV